MATVIKIASDLLIRIGKDEHINYGICTLLKSHIIGTETI